MKRFIEDLIDHNLSSGMYKLDPDVIISNQLQLLKQYEFASA